MMHQSPLHIDAPALPHLSKAITRYLAFSQNVVQAPQFLIAESPCHLPSLETSQGPLSVLTRQRRSRSLQSPPLFLTTYSVHCMDQHSSPPRGLVSTPLGSVDYAQSHRFQNLTGQIRLIKNTELVQLQYTTIGHGAFTDVYKGQWKNDQSTNPVRHFICIDAKCTQAP